MHLAGIKTCSIIGERVRHYQWCTNLRFAIRIYTVCVCMDVTNILTYIPAFNWQHL